MPSDYFLLSELYRLSLKQEEVLRSRIKTLEAGLVLKGAELAVKEEELTAREVPRIPVQAIGYGLMASISYRLRSEVCFSFAQNI